MQPRNLITLYGEARMNVDNLCTLCKAGKPREVLAKIRTVMLDCTTLTKKLFVHEASPIPVHPTRHPFQTACLVRNYPIVRLLLELGADPDADCCATISHTTPRQMYANDPQLQELFEGGKLWWKVKYPEEKKTGASGRT